ncbi:arsenate reductase [Syntrophus gentianae]|uniref:Arsenate reductase n=1 Tax=Syntrophus gentianae TaxID=43775 RepID=A0A1H8ALG7_9BACT|nr:arsenate reductase ArsC [Syntrophus gentianae]SEM71580.1 arsenate reductase [Syntrophus gentianae]
MDTNRKKRILFVCTHNSSRSQMAEGLLRALLGDHYEAFSAGTEPTRVHPGAIEAMAEIGIDIRNHRSKGLSFFGDEPFDEVVTVCGHAQEICPVVPGTHLKRHQGFEDPATATGTEADVLAAFRRVRDEIRAWILETY